VAHASPLAGWLRGIQAVTVIDYHGITPPEFVRAWDPGLAVALARAREEVKTLATRAALGIAHSGYTRTELDVLGFPRTATLPILLDPGRLAHEPSAHLLSALAAGGRGHDWLFVSRMAPNKRIEDVIKAFAVYRRAWCAEARLFLVGRPDTAAYDAALRRFAERLGVEEVHFAGKVPVADLVAFYRSADLFVSMSEHEGFGVPLLEAMASGVPVLAFAAGAVPETLGGAGLLFTEKRYDEVAALAAQVLDGGPLRERLVTAGRGRVEAFAPGRVAAAWVDLIGGLV
jgi:glycosyltransferase involved in cell wall biosynthesis